MRESRVITVADEGRDKGKVFVVKEMSAWAIEKWSYRLLLALARAGVDIKTIEGTGTAGLAMAGILAMPQLDFRDAEPLLDEMSEYFYARPDPARPETERPIFRTANGEGDDVQEMTTLLTLRTAFMEMHTRFFVKGMPSKA